MNCIWTHLYGLTTTCEFQDLRDGFVFPVPPTIFTGLGPGVVPQKPHSPRSLDVEVKKKRRVGFQLQAGRQKMRRAGQVGWSTLGTLGWTGWYQQCSAQEYLENENWAVWKFPGGPVVSALNAGALGQGTKIPQAVWQKKKKKRRRRNKERKEEKRRGKKELTGCVMAGVTGVGMEEVGSNCKR